jgi:hypothetical protein
MVSTFTTSQECFYYATGSNVTVGTTTRPSEAAIDLMREVAYRQIYQITGTATDSNGIAKMVELMLVKIQIDALLAGSPIIPILTEDMVNMLMDAFDSRAMGTWEPNANGSLTG